MIGWWTRAKLLRSPLWPRLLHSNTPAVKLKEHQQRHKLFSKEICTKLFVVNCTLTFKSSCYCAFKRKQSGRQFVVSCEPHGRYGSHLSSCDANPALWKTKAQAGCEEAADLVEVSRSTSDRVLAWRARFLFSTSWLSSTFRCLDEPHLIWVGKAFKQNHVQGKMKTLANEVSTCFLPKWFSTRNCRARKV